MRPRTLKLEGFSAFKDFSEINFEGLQLTVFTGPNGSGKSSLLESMLFALYGTTPRMKGKQSKELISHGKDSFHIDLEFEANNSLYRVQRRVYKKNPSQVRLDLQKDGQWQSLADKVKETDENIVRILGLGYDTFTKAVILPQNLFDQFLKGDKEKRREVLEEILSLGVFEKVAALAGEKYRLTKDRLKQIESQLAELLGATSPETLQALEEAQIHAKTEISELQAKQAKLNAGLAEFMRLQEKEKHVESMRKEIAELERELGKASKELLENEQILSKMNAELTQNEDRFQVYIREQENLMELKSLCEEVEKLTAKIRNIQSESKATSENLVKSQNEKKFIQDKIEQIKTYNQELRKKTQVHDLQSQLIEGQPCPVCGQEIHRLPPIGDRPGEKETDLSSFESSLHRKLADEARLQEANAGLSKELNKNSEKLMEVQERKTALENALAQILALETANLLVKAREEFKTLKTNQEAMSKQRAEKEKALQVSSRLKEWLRQINERSHKLKETEISGTQEMEAIKQNLLKPLAALGHSDEKNIPNLQLDLQNCQAQLSVFQAEAGKIQQKLEEYRKNKEKTQKIEESKERLKKEEALYMTLQQDLQKNKLPDFLLSTVLTTLLDLAGEKFTEFSQGRYQFALEGTGDIQVLDGWNAGEARAVASLSGGENFAASLALALALSEYLQGRQQMQSLFIDEGFGNLDRETRDKVAEVLSSLQSQEKLIGIVTHIEELAELFPHRVVIEKLPEGSRIHAQAPMAF